MEPRRPAAPEAIRPAPHRSGACPSVAGLGSTTIPALVRSGLVLLTVLFLAACSAPVPLPGTVSGPEQRFETARPAVVIVGTFYSVTWSAPLPTLTAEAARRLRQQAAAEIGPRSGGGTPVALGQAELRLLADDPGAWLSVGSERHRQTDVVEVQGSGFFVTQDGALLTNDHVVDLPHDQIQRLLVSGLEQEGGDAAAVAGLQQEVSEALGVPVDDARARQLLRWAVRRAGSDLQIESVSASYRVGFGSRSMRQLESDGVPVTLLRHGAPAPGRDVALLRAPGGPYPALALAPSAPGAGAHLDVVGYPCGCGQQPAADRILTPTLSQGRLVDLLPMPGGWDALGTDASIQSGDSGGPVLDDRGRVVGLATFTAAAGGARAFAVPVEVARQLLREAGVRPAQGTVGREYARAVAEFDRRHYRAALPLFQHLVAIEDHHDPYAAAYLERSQQAIAAGADRTPPAWAGAVPVVLLGLLAAAMAVIAVLLLRRRRRRRWVEGEILVGRPVTASRGRSTAPERLAPPERPALPGETIVEGEAWWE